MDQQASPPSLAVELIPNISIFVMIAVCWFAILRHGGRGDLIYTIPILVVNLLALRNLLRSRKSEEAE